MSLKRKKNENYLSFLKRVTSLCEEKVISYQEWSDSILGDEYKDYYSDEYVRRAYTFIKKALENVENEELYVQDDTEINNLLDIKESIITERKKLQTVNTEAQEYYRERARSELLAEQIRDAIANLPPIDIRIEPNDNSIGYSSRTALLTIADTHYDSNYEIKGYNGENINEYNKEIFKRRMNLLLNKVAHESNDFHYDKMKVVCMGDCIEGLIRMNSLKKLRQPVVQSVVEFAEFMSYWLLRLTAILKIPVEFALVPGNHSICRFLGQRPEFEDENLEYIIYKFIELRLADCNMITLAPYNEVYITHVFDKTLAFAHGENKDLEQLIRYLDNICHINIDTCYGAHYHKGASNDIGIGNIDSKKVIRVPSIVGTDPYSHSLMKANKAGAYFAIFDVDGEYMNKVYYLN